MGRRIQEDLRKWFSPSHPKGGWKRINTKGEVVGPCAREPGEPKPKCMSNQKRAQLSKRERAAAVRTKRKHDPNPERKGDPIMVSNFGKGRISEEYEIDPRDNLIESLEVLLEKNKPTSPDKWDDCVSQAKAKFDVYPSAYANGWASQCYKRKGGKWKSVDEERLSMLDFIDHGGILREIKEANECENRQSGKPWRTPGEKKKFAVCADGKLVRFGDPGLSIKRDQPGRLKNFRARHGCDKGGIARDTPKYWSCQMWRKDKSVGDITKGG
jgi:hypothetical protein